MTLSVDDLVADPGEGKLDPMTAVMTEGRLRLSDMAAAMALQAQICALLPPRCSSRRGRALPRSTGTDAAPVPAGAAAEWFAGAGVRGVAAGGVVAVASAPSRGSVLVSGGRTEPIEKYFEVARRAGVARWLHRVLMHDWRRQGASQRLLP